MKNLKLEEMSNINGGISNRECAILGGLAFAAVLGMQWSAAVGVTALATVSGCFKS